jgi:hypothetical protein
MVYVYSWKKNLTWDWLRKRRIILNIAYLWQFWRFFWWGDGTSPNDVSLYEYSGTPSHQINRPGTQHVPRMIHPCHYMRDTIHICDKNDRDVSMQGHFVSGTIHLGDQGSQKIRTGTHRFGTSRHPTQPITSSTDQCSSIKFISKPFHSSLCLLYFYERLQWNSTTCSAITEK